MSPTARGTRLSRIAEASSTSARSGPAYSSTIASCTIVSSRWVDGLSTGSRPVSATRPARAPRRRAGWPGDRPLGSCRIEVTMSARFVDPTGTESAKIATSRVGSTSARMVSPGWRPCRRTRCRCPARPTPTRPPPASAAPPPRTDPRPPVGYRSMVTNGATGHHRDGGGQHQQWRRPEHLAGAAGGDGLLAGQLAQVTPRLQHAAPARPSNRARIWRITPTSNGDPTATRAICRSALITPATLTALPRSLGPRGVEHSAPAL